MPPAERQQRARDRVEEEQLTGGPRANLGRSVHANNRHVMRERYIDACKRRPSRSHAKIETDAMTFLADLQRFRQVP